MKVTTYYCNGPNKDGASNGCGRTTEDIEEAKWVSLSGMDGAEIHIENFHPDRRIVEGFSEKGFHFCSKQCFFSYFFK